MPRPLFSHLLNLQQPTAIPVAVVSVSGALGGRLLTIADTTAGSLTLTLPGAAALQGRQLLVWKKVNPNAVIIQCAAGDHIDYSGAVTSLTLNVIDAKAWLISDGGSVWLQMLP
jgi:hypothetical protein